MTESIALIFRGDSLLREVQFFPKDHRGFTINADNGKLISALYPEDPKMDSTKFRLVCVSGTSQNESESHGYYARVKQLHSSENYNPFHWTLASIRSNGSLLYFQPSVPVFLAFEPGKQATTVKLDDAISMMAIKQRLQDRDALTQHFVTSLSSSGVTTAIGSFGSKLPAPVSSAHGFYIDVIQNNTYRHTCSFIFDTENAKEVGMRLLSPTVAELLVSWKNGGISVHVVHI